MLGYLITALAGVFWFTRVAITLLFTTENAFPIVPLNLTFEIVLLFVTFACIVLIAKRKMFGAIVYLLAQGAYFGVDAYKNLETIIQGVPDTSTYLSLFISVIAVLLPIFAIMDIGLNTGKKGSMRNKKTDWFYGTTEYDRNMDDRADKNQYKF